MGASREFYRFVLAMTILVLFGLLLIAAMAGGYSDPTVLAGMFSGWIVAIIGFYFMDEVSQRTIGQETHRIVDEQWTDSEASLEESLKKKDAVVDNLKKALANLSKDSDEQLKEKEKNIRNLTDKVTSYMALADEFSETVEHLKSELEAKREG